MLSPEESRRLGWVPYVMDYSFEQGRRFTAAVDAAQDFEDLPRWVKEAAEAADRKVGVPPRRCHRRDGVGRAATDHTASA